MPIMQSTRFGELEIREDSILVAARPIPGFPGSTRYTLLAGSDTDAILWLHSLDEAHVAFPVADPQRYYPDYEVSARKEDLAPLGVGEETMDSVRVLSLLVVPAGDPMATTLNLRAPLIINTASSSFFQLINDDETWPLRAPMFAEAAVS